MLVVRGADGNEILQRRSPALTERLDMVNLQEHPTLTTATIGILMPTPSLVSVENLVPKRRWDVAGVG